MPIYEYEAILPEESCLHCGRGFETIQGMNDAPLTACPECGREVRRIISWCRAAVVERSSEDSRVESRVTEYERAGMWSHAAELADTHSDKTRDKSLQTRAYDNYKKAGYDVDSLISKPDSK